LAGASTPVGGRRPVALHYVSTAKYVFGVDIGASKTIAMVTDLDGNVVYREKFPSYPEGKPSPAHIRVKLAEALRKSGVVRDHILGTGIGFPGVTQDGMVVDAPGLRLHNFPAGEFFRDLPGPVSIDNDVNLAVIGERWKGAAIGRNNVVLVAVGTGIGAGFLFDGRIYRGAHGFAGEMGHLHLDPASPGPKLNLSDYGPLEQVASGKGMEDTARRELPNYPDSRLHGRTIHSELIFEAAAAGDALVRSVVQRASTYLSFSIANLVSLLNPDVVIVGGGVSRAGAPFFEQIQAGVARLSPVTCEIVPAGLGEDAGVFGSVATVLLQAGELRLSGFDEWGTVSQSSGS